MGKATILSGGEDGRYTVRLDFGAELRDARVTALNAKIAELAAAIPDWQATLDAFRAEEEAPAEAAVDAAVAAYIAATKTLQPAEVIKQLLDAHTAAIKALLAVRTRYGPLALELDRMKAEKAQAEKDLAPLEALDLEEEVEVWCADVSEEGSGEVGTIEIPGEYGGGQAVIIAPGALEHVPADGAIVAREVQTGAQAYFNAAILPGWQRHMPTYRAGTITALDLDADTADVALDPARSSAQDLDINQAATLAAVPVRYMTCNASAFEVDDRVVVEFEGQDWESPRVIGFVSNPKRCRRVTIAFDSGDHYYMMEFLPSTFGARYFTSLPVIFPTSQFRGVFFFDDRVWTTYTGSVAAPKAGFHIKAHDGSERVLGAKSEHLSVDGDEIVCSLIKSPPAIGVLDTDTLLVKREHEWLLAGARIDAIKAHNGKVVVGGWTGTQNFVRVLDHRNDWLELHAQIPFGYVRDVAISRKYFATLLGNSGMVFTLYDIQTGNILDQRVFPFETVGAISITDAHAVVCEDMAAETLGADGRVVVYEIVDGALVLSSRTTVWPDSGSDSGVAWAGN